MQSEQAQEPLELTLLWISTTGERKCLRMQLLLSVETPLHQLSHGEKYKIAREAQRSMWALGVQSAWYEYTIRRRSVRRRLRSLIWLHGYVRRSSSKAIGQKISCWP